MTGMPRERDMFPRTDAAPRNISPVFARIISMSVSGWSGYVPRSAEPTESR